MVIPNSLFLDSLSRINLYMVIIILVIIVRCRRSSEWCLIPHWRKKVDGPRMRPAGPAIIASPTAPFPLYSSLYLWCNISFFRLILYLRKQTRKFIPPPPHTHIHFSIAFLGFFFIFIQIGFDRLFPLHLFHLWSPVSIFTYRPKMPATLYSWYVMDQNISQNWKQRHQTRLNPNL